MSKKSPPRGSWPCIISEATMWHHWVVWAQTRPGAVRAHRVCKDKDRRTGSRHKLELIQAASQASTEVSQTFLLLLISVISTQLLTPAICKPLLSQPIWSCPLTPSAQTNPLFLHIHLKWNWCCRYPGSVGEEQLQHECVAWYLLLIKTEMCVCVYSSNMPAIALCLISDRVISTNKTQASGAATMRKANYEFNTFHSSVRFPLFPNESFCPCSYQQRRSPAIMLKKPKQTKQSHFQLLPI